MSASELYSYSENAENGIDSVADHAGCEPEDIVDCSPSSSNYTSVAEEITHNASISASINICLGHSGLNRLSRDGVDRGGGDLCLHLGLGSCRVAVGRDDLGGAARAGWNRLRCLWDGSGLDGEGEDEGKQELEGFHDGG
ncbi:MAG: hypothetical protein M1838_006085 [Thelocarpon superellum]|nr:MAG: hypothetical protein M1838_006085 [Thelocarpon superellum]